MRELGFAIVGAAALIGLGLWAISKADADDWTASAQRAQTASTSAPSVGAGSAEDLN